MSIITLFSAFMGLYVIVRIILPSGMNWPLKLILSLFALACAEKLLLTKLVYGTMGAFMPEPVQLASGYLHSAVCGKPCGSLPCVKSVCKSPACRMR